MYCIALLIPIHVCRERKFINRANDHIQVTAQRFCDETALLSACFSTLEEDVREHDQREVRTHDRRLLSAVLDIRQIRDRIDTECALRLVEDNDILDSVIETQKLLQQTVSLSLFTSRRTFNVLIS